MSNPRYLESLASQRRQLNDLLGSRGGYQLHAEPGDVERWFIIDADGIVVGEKLTLDEVERFLAALERR